jgi:hypothetical protein
VLDFISPLPFALQDEQLYSYPCLNITNVETLQIGNISDSSILKFHGLVHAGVLTYLAL